MTEDFYVKLNNMDWALLREQKLALVTMMMGGAHSEEEKEALEGIVSLLDTIQDDAARQLGAEAVFGPEELKS